MDYHAEAAANKLLVAMGDPDLEKDKFDELGRRVEVLKKTGSN
jgi:hypothetical protein